MGPLASALQSKIQGVTGVINNALTPAKQKALLTYQSNRRKPDTKLVSSKDTYPYTASKMPKGTVFGAFPQK